MNKAHPNEKILITMFIRITLNLNYDFVRIIKYMHKRWQKYDKSESLE